MTFSCVPLTLYCHSPCTVPTFKLNTCTLATVDQNIANLGS